MKNRFFTRKLTHFANIVPADQSLQATKGMDINMIIKKYLADTETEAVDAAKKELGPDVVIMNVRSIKRKGITRFFKRPLKEVTVGLEEETERFSAAVKDIARVVSEQADKEDNLFRSGGAAQSDGFQRTLSQSAESVSAGRAAERRNTQEYIPAESVIENKLDSLQILLQETLVKTEEEAKEVQDKEPSEGEAFLKLLYNTMIDNEVDEHYANQIIDTLDVKGKTQVPIDYYLANVYQKIILKFGKTSMIEEAKVRPKIVYFIGPTGVGKTTTIAKIASKFCVEQKKKIALLTTDTYRIAAAEQLRTYANILDVPIRVIYSVEEMENAIKDFTDYDYILVDTAGHSHHNTEQRKATSDFIKASDQKADREVYLVISATTKYRDMLSIADSYAEITEYKLIFTKLDETVALGNLFNLRMKTGADMSYVTYGQNVPDDISPFNPQAAAKQLLGGRKQD